MADEYKKPARDGKATSKDYETLPPYKEKINKFWEEKVYPRLVKVFDSGDDDIRKERRDRLNASELERKAESARPVYERVENPSYKPVKKYSLLTSMLGFILAASGLVTGLYPLTYAGAALGFGSLGYSSGHWFRQMSTDVLYRKVKGLEKKVLEPYEDKTLYENRFVPGDVQKAYHDEFDMRLKSELDMPRSVKYAFGKKFFGKGRESTARKPSEHAYSPRPSSSKIGTVGTVAGIWGLLAGFFTYAFAGPAYGLGVAIPSLSLLATSIAHMIGYKIGDKKAKPDYREVGGIEKKIEALPEREPLKLKDVPYWVKSSLFADYQRRIGHFKLKATRNEKKTENQIYSKYEKELKK